MSTAVEATYQNLQIEPRGPVVVLRVHRPEVLNALDHATLTELEMFATRFLADPAQAALVVTGGGEKSFVAGADIKELAALDPRGLEEASRFGQRVFAMFERSPKPVIAAVNGFALGGGCELALACHIRLASENAVLGLPEVGLGLIPGYGGTQRLPRLVGRGRALELVLTGRKVKADEAEQLALAILKNAPLAVASAVEAVDRGLSLPLDDALRLESGLFGMLGATHDTHEGLTAFLEKRAARFERR